MSKQTPILSASGSAPTLEIGGSKLIHRIDSASTHGAFSVVEFVSQPGEGVGVHTHEREDELVYLLEGEIRVSLATQEITVSQGACALLPRGIPHGYTNIGTRPSRLLAVLLPGGLDGFFVALSEELAIDQPHEEAIAGLCRAFGLTFLQESGK